MSCEKSYCNYCSYICEKNHNCKKSLVEDILLTVVGGEIGLVKNIMRYKRDLEYETKTIDVCRFTWLETYSKIKTIKVTNKFENKLEISFKPERKYSKTYNCELELDEPIKINDRPDLFNTFFETFDIPLAVFMRKNKTNENLKKYLKRHIETLNIIHNDIEDDILY